jgi:hypothetical protein
MRDETQPSIEPKKSEGDDKKSWAVCPVHGDSSLQPVYFPTYQAALAYKDEILIPATIDGALLPSPRVVEVPHDLAHLLMQGISVGGPFCGVSIQVGGRATVRVKFAELTAKCGDEWLVLEREDGTEWPAQFHPDGVQINGGIGAIRKPDPTAPIGPLYPFPPGIPARAPPHRPGAAPDSPREMPANFRRSRLPREDVQRVFAG